MEYCWTTNFIYMKGGKTMKQFWCCYVEDTGGCRYKHEYPEQAIAEAERLAMLPENRGKKVFVLKAVKVCHVPATLVQWEELTTA